VNTDGGLTLRLPICELVSTATGNATGAVGLSPGMVATSAAVAVELGGTLLMLLLLSLLGAVSVASAWIVGRAAVANSCGLSSPLCPGLDSTPVLPVSLATVVDVTIYILHIYK